MAYSGSRVVFRCIAPDTSPPVIYELMRDGGVPIAKYRDPQGEEPASFPVKVTARSEGSYQCKATAGRTTGISNTIKLSVVIPPSSTRVMSEPFPPVVYEESYFFLSCEVETGSHLSFTWFFNRKEITSSNSTLFHLNGNKLVMERVIPEHAGHYSCAAWSSINNIKRFSTSTEVPMTIKVYVSKPKISFYIHKEGASYHGNVTCWSSRGSPPVNISLLLDGKEVGSITAAQSLSAWFPVPMVPGLDMGEAQCRVKTEKQELMSEPVTLEVVPVGGDVKVEVEYLYTAESKLATARLICYVSRGSFPYFLWLLNDSVLHSESHLDSHIQPLLPHFAFANQRQTLILTKLSPEESGYYRCRARDSYDESAPWVESAAELVQATEVHMTLTEAVSIAFCCFVLLMLAAGSVCVCKMFSNKQAHTNSAPANSDAPQIEMISQSGGDLADISSAECDHDVQNQTIEVTV